MEYHYYVVAARSARDIRYPRPCDATGVAAYTHAVRRIAHTRAVTKGPKSAPDPRKAMLLLKLRLCRWLRTTIPYDLVTSLKTAWPILAPINAFDLFR